MTYLKQPAAPFVATVHTGVGRTADDAAGTSGADLAPGGAGVNAVQTVTLDENANGGHIHLTYDGVTSGTIAYNADAATMQTALRAMTSIGPKSEVQVVTVNGSPTGGTFALEFQGQRTTDLAYNALSATVQAALEALSTIGVGNVTVAGDGPHTVTFANALANRSEPLIVAHWGALQGGGDETVTVARSVTGREGSVVVSGSAGAWIVTFMGEFARIAIDLMTADITALTSTGTAACTVATSTAGRADSTVPSTKYIRSTDATRPLILTCEVAGVKYRASVPVKAESAHILISALPWIIDRPLVSGPIGSLAGQRPAGAGVQLRVP